MKTLRLQLVGERLLVLRADEEGDVVHALLRRAGQHQDLVARAAGAAKADAGTARLGLQAEGAVELFRDTDFGHLQPDAGEADYSGFIHCVSSKSNQGQKRGPSLFLAFTG